MIVIEMIYAEHAPVTAMRARSSSKSGRHYTPEKYRQYKRFLANAIRSRYHSMCNSVPATGTKERASYLKNNRFGILLLAYRAADRGDGDNYLKAVQDALQDAGVIGNDSQIDWSFTAKLVDRRYPRIEFVLVKSPKSLLDLVLMIYNWIRVKLGGEPR